MPEEREDLLRETGKKIQLKREALGYSLEDVHDGTKIRINFLQGIENGDYSGFPGTVYVRGFIRTYLQFLGAEELWSEFLPVLSEGMEKKRSDELVMGSCTPPTKGFKPASKLWLFVLLLMIVTGSGWYVWYSWEQSGISLFDGKDDHPVLLDEKHAVVEPVEEDTLVIADRAEDAEVPSSLEDDEKAAVEDETPEGEAAQPHVPLTTAAELVGLTEPPSETPAPEPEKKEEGSLVITADGDCWVRIREGDKTVYERTMKAGDTAEFKVTQRYNVVYGRGGAVTVRWNGQDIGRPGRGVERVYYDPDGSTGKTD
ncbi:MAG: helix-turn-helix domain-containing protein [Synergistaceae bacterium]|nr:helix-turn-helix domain-containing protein [Synergistaceae bacterium]